MSSEGENPYALEAAMWRVLYRLHKKGAQEFSQLKSGLNIERSLLEQACERLEQNGSIEQDNGKWMLIEGRWGDAVLKTMPRVET